MRSAEFSCSQAPPGNTLLARLCLAETHRRSQPDSAFPGAAWERVRYAYLIASTIVFAL
jgi:hypothetical protein